MTGYYAERAREMLSELPWGTITHYMDDGIREELHAALAPCDDERFLVAYMERHADEFGEDFAIN